jgi:hypothetical protein
LSGKQALTNSVQQTVRRFPTKDALRETKNRTANFPDRGGMVADSTFCARASHAQTNQGFETDRYPDFN